MSEWLIEDELLSLQIKRSDKKDEIKDLELKRKQRESEVQVFK
jgi:hypothetical protein